ncbi:uncharacterized protein LOC100562789 isoform X3 [Anolis carolinensis]|uniref:uncharacterized protein LOC100562789 isoform X3 n=1 Tax=Anolis carolinensis TaxID=28377 RepID=UPI002F2B6E9C
MTPERKADSHWRKRKEARLSLCGAPLKCREAPPLCGHRARGCHVSSGRKSTEEGRPLPREAEDEWGRVSALREEEERASERVRETKEEESGGGYLFLAPKGTQSGFTEHTHGKYSVPDSTIKKDRRHRQRLRTRTLPPAEKAVLRKEGGCRVGVAEEAPG